MKGQFVAGQRLGTQVPRALRQRRDGTDVVADALPLDLTKVRQTPGPEVRPPSVIHDDLGITHQDAYRPVVVRPPENSPDLDLRRPHGPSLRCRRTGHESSRRATVTSHDPLAAASPVIWHRSV